MDFVQESRAQGAIEALRGKFAFRARVLREGRETTVPVAELVIGDGVQLCAGDVVPPDGRLLATRDFFVNQALLTGEPCQVEKRAKDGEC